MGKTVIIAILNAVESFYQFTKTPVFPWIAGAVTVALGVVALINEPKRQKLLGGK